MMHAVARRLGQIVLLALFCALLFAAHAETRTLQAGDLTGVVLSDAPQTFAFTPTANGLYSLYLFPDGDLTVHAELSVGGERLAQGDNALRLFSLRLVAGTSYTVSLSGSGSARMELAREALSRSFDQPLELSGDYSKLIARAGDVHWYSIASDEAAAALIAAVARQPELALEMKLFDESGRLLAEGDGLPSGSCALSYELARGGRYRLRVFAPDGGTGKYRLSVQRSDSLIAAEQISLSAQSLSLEGWSSTQLTARLPAGACPLTLCDSSNPSAAVFHADGRVNGHRAGSARLTVYAYGGAQAFCDVTVSHVPVEKVEIRHETSTMKVGDSQKLTVTLTPENATDRKLTFVTDDENVISVDADGTLHAVGEGTARIVVIAGDGACTDMVYVAVEPAGRRYRALLIGEQNYASTVDKIRPGSIRSVESLAALLALSSFNGEGYQITTLMDAPRDEVIAGIRSAFSGASDRDLSLIYITCHGFYRAGMTFFVMADGSVLSASDLERELRGVSGEIVLLADCCGSGGLLGEASGTDDLLDGVLSVFQGLDGGPMLRDSRIHVLASARLDQDSYRISFSQDGADGMATVFARALCDAGGWNIDRGAPGSKSADSDFNGEITFDELGRYMQRRVQWYLSMAGGYSQNVQYYPTGENLIILSQ